MAKRIVRLTEEELGDLIIKSLISSDKDLLSSIIAAADKYGKKSLGIPDNVDLRKIEDLKPLETGELKPVVSLKGNLPNMDFYQSLLKKLNAPVTDENLKFLYAWRQAEGNGGKYNPFNTTLKKPGSRFFNFLNSKKTIGVQSYPNSLLGLEATVDTLKHKRYSCITDGLRQDIGAAEIASKCSSALKTWGTGDLVSKVIAGYDRGASIKVKDIA